MPMFFSTVEVKGHIFRGKVGKSKKQAELNAAKVAYSFLNDRKSLVSFLIISMSRSWKVI
jgi:dsRNA-specific ribonuclease